MSLPERNARLGKDTSPKVPLNVTQYLEFTNTELQRLQYLKDQVAHGRRTEFPEEPHAISSAQRGLDELSLGEQDWLFWEFTKQEILNLLLVEWRIKIGNLSEFPNILDTRYA